MARTPIDAGSGIGAADGEDGFTAFQKVNAMFQELYESQGWVDHADTVFTEASPFELRTYNTPVVLPNNAGRLVSTQAPKDGSTLYDGTHIVGRNGDLLGVKIRFKAVPKSQSTSFLELKIDIDGVPDIVEDQFFAFPKGANVVRPVNASGFSYTLDTWEANGGEVQVLSDGPVDIYDISFVVARLYKAQ